MSEKTFCETCSRPMDHGTVRYGRTQLYCSFRCWLYSGESAAIQPPAEGYVAAIKVAERQEQKP